jgi:hypothetical protein
LTEDSATEKDLTPEMLDRKRATFGGQLCQEENEEKDRNN